MIYEDERLGARARGASLSGPELASLMKIGTRVVRGKDWKWGDQVLKVRFPQDDHLGKYFLISEQLLDLQNIQRNIFRRYLINQIFKFFS